MKQRSEQGVALVITLIMLSVVTVMAVAFLALTRREKAAVANASEQTDSQHMAEVGLERAKGEIIARVLENTNWTAVDLMVSRNLINENGFAAGLTNVNYDYAAGGGALNAQQWVDNIANLWIDPRVPVFINTNRAGTQGPLDFRFYVDLNQNGRFDTNGFYVPYDNAGSPDPNGLAQFHVGDLEWIGVLERPHLPHSSSNRFFGRYAFIVIPVGKTLDLNFIHNDGKQMMRGGAPSSGTDNGFYRNQGFGSWEINLAGFLAHLNTNYWPLDASALNPYSYVTNLTASSGGSAFSDATDLLRFRYNSRYQNLFSASFLLPTAVWGNFQSDQIDAYAASPNPSHGGALELDADLENLPWPGASSTPTNHFFSIHDFFRPGAGLPYSRFIDRLSNACHQANSYDRETLYRLLAQLGTDSAPEPETAQLRRLGDKLEANSRAAFPAEPIGRINLNWDNISDGSPGYTPLSAPWPALKFFTNVANVLLRSIGGTNQGIYIPVYPTNLYTLEVHRMLQLAANLYDATTTNWYPTVFRPVVTSPSAGVSAITDFVEDSDDATIPQFLAANANTFGLPMVIGVKKGIPNFNEFAVQTVALGARKLELRRDNTNSPPNETNQMFVVGVSNSFAVEVWNSYSNSVSSNLPVGNLNMTVGCVVGLTVTNSDGLYYQNNYAFNGVTNIIAQNWGAYQPRLFSGGFIIPVATNIILLTNSGYRANPPSLVPITFNMYERNQGFPVPEWIMTTSNRLVYFLTTEQGRILDFVYLDQITNTMNLTQTLMELNPDVYQADAGIIAQCWDTNRLGGAAMTAVRVPTQGIVQQLQISVGDLRPSVTDWNAFNFGPSRNAMQIDNEIQSFRDFVGLQATVKNPNTVVQTPFNPARKIVQTVSWQANDPLVHHRVEHLKDVTNNVSTIFIRPVLSTAGTGTNINRLNDRYRPWGGRPGNKGHPNDLNHAVKDPGVTGSQDWDFPTNKFPSIGWMGRVHRGTPWQTVYLKAEVADNNAWLSQFIDMQSHPTNDWKLIDMFTVAAHPNATRGQMSINQTNLASWSALLSGVFVLTNLAIDTSSGAAYARNFDGVLTNLVDTTIEPNTDAFRRIVDGINRVRNRLPDQTFRRLGDILQVPELSIGYHYDTNGAPMQPLIESPYLLRDNPINIEYGLSDAAYERIPQQILSLLRVGDPRYVIYALGQSLKPADNSIITTPGTYFGMCTNYQITGEVVTRSVVHLEGQITRPKAAIEAFNILPID